LSDPRQLLSRIEQAAPGRPLAACQASASPLCQMFWYLLSAAPSPSPLRSLRRPIESAQYLSIKYTERLKDAGVEPSVGSVGDSYDNALAETINGLPGFALASA
jgi:hypothetical protein